MSQGEECGRLMEGMREDVMGGKEWKEWRRSERHGSWWPLVRSSVGHIVRLKFLVSLKLHHLRQFENMGKGSNALKQNCELLQNTKICRKTVLVMNFVLCGWAGMAYQ